jgi:glutaredoxin-like protein NrdH
MIKVYTNENCVQCDQTKKFLDSEGIAYEVKPFAENPDDLKRFVDLGFRAAPIVETENDVWSGFKIDKLKSLKAVN